jgi:omega-6 fatty acid desaturase (delta-12 desaturase)
LPQELTQKDIRGVIPARCYEISKPRSYWTAARVMAVYGAGVAATHLASHWALLPILWFLTGTAMTGLFVAAHECGHMAFSRSRRESFFWGHVFLIPFFYPFHGWRHSHNVHHQHTNNRDADNAWNNAMTEQQFNREPGYMQLFLAAVRGPLWFLGSIVHAVHAQIEGIRSEGQRRRETLFSVAVGLLSGIAWYAAFVHWWGAAETARVFIAPFFVFHFWLSTFTLLHHSHEDTRFFKQDEWTFYRGQVASTVYCRFPRWIEWMVLDINVHVPHHVSAQIPWYHLREATAALRERYGGDMISYRFSFRRLFAIINGCPRTDEEGRFRPLPKSMGGVLKSWIVNASPDRADR